MIPIITLQAMMMTKSKISKYLKWLFIVLFSFTRVSAESDFESWHAIELQGRFSPKTDIWLSNEMRFNNNSTEFKKYLLDFGIDHKITKRFTITGAYRFTHFYDNTNYKNEHVAYSIFKYTQRIQRYVIEIQTRWQYTAEIFNHRVDKEEWLSRNKITVNYKWPTQPLTPYVAFEHFIQLSPYVYSDKYRIMIGIKYNFSKKHSASLYYGLQQWFNENKISYLVGWKYGYTFTTYKKKKLIESDD